MEITASNLNADTIQALLREREKQKAEEMRKREETAQAARDKLHEAFMTEDVPQDALDQVALMVRKAVEMGERQVLVFRFPSNWLPDRGRAIINQEADWHAHLVGIPQRAYAYFERELKPRGFQVHAEIVDWPNGMPGDVSIFLRWKRPNAM